MKPSRVFDEVSLHRYSGTLDLLSLYLIAIVENFAYRQLTAIWRIHGLVRRFGGGKHE